MGLKAISEDFYVIGINYPWHEIEELSEAFKKEVGTTVLDAAQECNKDLGYEFNFTLKLN